MNWDNFFFAQAGAAAGLTGLIFVAVSLNLKGILAAAYLPNRALQSLLLLLNILILSSIMLIPGQKAFSTGIEILIISLSLYFVVLRLGVTIYRNSPDAFKKHSIINLVLLQICTLPFVAGGMILCLTDETGKYFIVPGIFMSLMKAIADAWVLLFEIHR